MADNHKRVPAPTAVPPAPHTPPAPPPDHRMQSEVAGMVKPVIAAGQEKVRRENELLQQQQLVGLHLEQNHRTATDSLISGAIWAALIGGGLGVLAGLAKGRREKATREKKGRRSA